MGTLDQLAAAGFSQQEMDGYAAQQRQQLSAGGFSDQEINSYLGGAPAPHPDGAEANAAFAQAVGNHLTDAHNLINVGTGKDAFQTMKDIGSVYGPLEAALNVATGTVFGFPAYIAGGAAGLADKFILGDKTMDPAALAEKLSSAVTYQPKTEPGQRLAAAAQYPLQVLNDASMPAGGKVADVAQSLGLSNTQASWAGAFTAAAIQTLPAVLLGELGRKMGGQRIGADDMANVAKVVAGPDANPEQVQTVESSLRSTYKQTGIGPYTVLEQSRINPQIDADLKNPDVDVPQAFQQYARREQVGVPVSDAMKAVRPLEAETPVPGPVPEEAMAPEAAEIAPENAELNPGEIQPENEPISSAAPAEEKGMADLELTNEDMEDAGAFEHPEDAAAVDSLIHELRSKFGDDEAEAKLEELAKQHENSSSAEFTEALKGAVNGEERETAEGAEGQNAAGTAEGGEDRPAANEEAQQPQGRKLRGAEAQRANLEENNPFLGFLARNGVSLDDRADIIGGKGNRMVPGYGPLFRKNGVPLDELAQRAVEEGYLTQDDVESAEDTGGTRKLADMINDAVNGEKIFPLNRMHEALERRQQEDFDEHEAAFGLIGESLGEARERTAREEAERVAQGKAEREADQRAKVDSEVGEFSLTGSDRAADANADQGDMFGNTTLLHSGLSPIEAIQNLRVLARRILQTDIGQKVSAAFQSGLRDLQLKSVPMAAGSDIARAVTKDAANAMRRAAWQWGAFDDLLKRGYTKEQREKMWNAADEENDLRTQGITDPSRGLGRLTDDERQTVQTLADYGNQLLGRAKAVGMFQGEGVQYWTPRMIAMIGEDGEVSAPRQERASSIEGKGGNITTSAGSLKGRKHATTAETEAAARAKFGEGAQVVRDIRTMPLAMARIERAIAGRELVNRIKEVGLQLGEETVSTGEKPGMFTIDHPAFKTYRTTEDGAMERAPLYISKEFEGPLKSIMTEKSGPLYQALMGIKGRVMSLIMYSPLIHNMVEWGRAMPMMPGKVITGRIYFEGNAAKHDPVTMRRAIDNGLAPIGHRFGNQDITGLVEEPNIQPGRGLVSKAVGGAVSMVNGKAGEAVKAAIDRAGDVWHNTLLWDRVADLQMGLYTNLERDMINKGLPPQTAGRLAAHFANRYAGSLPNEAMSVGARKLANLTLFSRTFTLGNIGAMKDILTGLPKDVQAQLVRDVGEAGRVGAVKAARQKALHAFVMDIGLLYVGNAIMQNAMDYVMRDKTVPQILQGYATRFKDYLTRADKDPSAILDIGSIFPNSQNEPGKEDRIFYSTAPDGTATYVRLPTGKIGEEFKGYLTSPLEMLKRKQGTLVRPLLQTLQNDKGFGRKVYDDKEPGVKGMMHAVGNVVWNILQEQIPLDSIESGYRLMHGNGDDTDALKVVGPLLGLTFSKGAPGGPEVGVMFDAEKRHQNEVASAMPDIRQDIKQGDVQDAITKMEAAHMTPQEQRLTLKYALNPQARLNRNRLKKFEQIAPTDDIERMERLQEEEQQETQSTQP